MENLNQVLWITVAGMGLTFAAIGLLVLAMVVLTRWTRGSGASTREKSSPQDIPTEEDVENLERAAAAAVAVALAQAARRAHPTGAWHASSPEAEPSPWQGYSRGQQLEQRKTHQTLRW